MGMSIVIVQLMAKWLSGVVVRHVSEVPTCCGTKKKFKEHTQQQGS